jgi:hypothetical protein
VSLVGAATLVVGFLVFLQQRREGRTSDQQIPAGEKAVRTVSLDRLRELGF